MEYIEAIIQSLHRSLLFTGHHQYQYYPNPFNTATTIGFHVQERKVVRLRVYDSIGRKVTTLIDRHVFPGHYAIRWEGNGLPSGTYFYRLLVGNQMLTKSMILQK